MMAKSLLPLGLLLFAGTTILAEELKPKMILKLARNTEASALAYSPDGKMLAVAVHRIPTTSSIFWEATEQIRYLLLKKDPPLKDGTAKLLDAASGKEIASLSVPGDCRSIAFRPDGKMLALGGEYHVRFWSLARGKPIEQATSELSSPHASSVYSLSFSHDGKELAVTSDTVMLWNMSGSMPKELITRRGIHRALFSPDGKTLVTLSDLLPAEPLKNWKDWKYVIKVWEASSRKEKAALEIPFAGGGGVTFTSDSKFLAYSVRVANDKVAKDLQNEVKLWNVSTQKEQRAFKGHPGGGGCSLAFSPDDKLLAVGCTEATVKVWDVATGKEIATLEGPGGAVNVVAFSPDGKTLASSYAGHPEIRLWEVPELLRQKKGK
jgi:WD40 repeat protein